MRLTSIVISVAITCLSACGANNAVPRRPTTAPISNNYWKLIELNGLGIAASGRDVQREMFLQLDAADQRVRGSGACNSFAGAYHLNGQLLKFSDMIRTEMACEALQLENEYLAALQKVDSYYVVGDTLRLTKGGTVSLAGFIAVPEKAVKK